MILLGDIGNTEVKIFLFNNKFKILKKINLKTKLISLKYLKSKLSSLNKKNDIIEKVLFSSVVPNVYKTIQIFFKKKYKHKYSWLNYKKNTKLGFVTLARLISWGFMLYGIENVVDFLSSGHKLFYHLWFQAYYFCLF